jgi:hypothetical protein
MNSRPLCLLLAAVTFSLAGCETPYKKSDKERAAKRKDQSGDPSFQAFLGRLRTAALKKDFSMLASLMVSDFGYRWDAPSEGETVFTYWVQNNIWPDLNTVLRENFVPKDEYMVAPPQFAADPNFPGYRAGIRVVNGSWRFVYFVPAPPPGETAPPQ